MLKTKHQDIPCFILITSSSHGSEGTELIEELKKDTFKKRCQSDHLERNKEGRENVVDSTKHWVQNSLPSKTDGVKEITLYSTIGTILISKMVPGLPAPCDTSKE